MIAFVTLFKIFYLISYFKEKLAVDGHFKNSSLKNEVFDIVDMHGEIKNLRLSSMKNKYACSVLKPKEVYILVGATDFPKLTPMLVNTQLSEELEEFFLKSNQEVLVDESEKITHNPEKGLQKQENVDRIKKSPKLSSDDKKPKKTPKSSSDDTKAKNNRYSHS